MCEYFRQKWRSQSNEAPACCGRCTKFGLTYPHWHRCVELLDIIQLVFSGFLHSQYEANFLDHAAAALSELEVWSSMYFVQSWLSENFVGRDSRSVAGLLRHCESKDLQLSRLGDAEQCDPWDSC